MNKITIFKNIVILFQIHLQIIMSELPIQNSNNRGKDVTHDSRVIPSEIRNRTEVTPNQIKKRISKRFDLFLINSKLNTKLEKP